MRRCNVCAPKRLSEAVRAPVIHKQIAAGIKRVLIGLALLFALLESSAAQVFPSRPVRFIAPFAAGGGSDLIARKLAHALTASLGQPVVVDNRTGGSGVIGTDLVAKSAPDGHTIMMTTPTFTVNPSLMAKLPYDNIRDFAPVTLIATAPHLLAVHPSLPVKFVKDVVALARARPDQLTFSSGSTGGSSHLSGALFNSMARIRMTHIPYRGGGQAVLAIVTGEVSLGFVDLVSMLPHVTTGRVHAIALTGLKRSAVLPNTPTVAESGYADFQSGIWYGVVAPARTPPEIVARLNSELVKITRTPDFLASLKAEGAEVVASSPDYFAEHIKRETSRWALVIKEAKIITN